MDNSRKIGRAKSVDGFVSNRGNSPLSKPFERAKSAKFLGNSRIIPKRAPEEIGSYTNKVLGLNNKLQSKVTLNSDPDIMNDSNNEPPKVEQTLSRRQRRINAQINQSKKKKTLKRALKYTILSIVALIIISAGYVGFKAFKNIDKVFGGNIISNIGSLFSSSAPLKGQSSGRINILIAGDSSDQLNHGGANLTDSILIASVDTQNHTAFLLSIPRDLWVYIPGWSWQKINAANDAYGTNFPGYPKNGMGQLEHIITTDLGIPIDYYALSDYGAFRDAVNAVGGVSINIQSPDPRGLYDPNTHLKLPNGPAFLDGQEALNLARARGDGPGSYGFPDSDFDRTEHQRQLFIAITKKAQTLGVLSNPIKIGNLFDALGNNVQTDLSLQNVLSLIHLTKNINLNTIKSYAYCSTLTLGLDGCNHAILTDYTSPSGEDALIPTAGIGNYSQMTEYYDSLISSNPISTEDASVVIENGTTVNGLAADYQTVVEKKGIDVASIFDASPTTKTEIIDNSNGKMPATKSYLESIFGNSIISSNSTNNPSGANFVVILGSNQKTPTAK